MKRVSALILLFQLGVCFAANSIIAIVNEEVITLQSIEQQLIDANSFNEKIDIVEKQIEIVLQMSKVRKLGLNPTQGDINGVLNQLAIDNNISMEQLQSYPQFPSLIQQITDRLSILNLQQYITKDLNIDLFENENIISKDELAPNTKFSNPLKNLYYKYIIRLDPYSYKSVTYLLRKFKKNINIIKGNSNEVLKKINIEIFDYVFLDGGHKYQTVKNDLESLVYVINNNGIVICDDYNLSYAPGVKKAIDEFVLSNNFRLNILKSRFAEITKDK